MFLVCVPHRGCSSRGCVDPELTKITIDLSSRGDEWPEEMNTLKHWLESNGYVNTSEGSGDNASIAGPKWWAARYERELNDEATKENMDSSAQIVDLDSLS